MTSLKSGVKMDLMKPVWTLGKRKSNYKLSRVNLYFEPGEELIFISSLSTLKREANLEKFNNLSSHNFTDKVGIYGDCHLFNSKEIGFSELDENKLSKDEKILGRRDYIYLFDNDQDGNGPNIHKILSKSNDKEISFFVNPSNTSTSDIIDEAVKFNHSNEKYFIVENNDLIFFCVPLQESITKKNSSNIDLFIKDRIKKKKLIKFKVPNGIYDICETEFVPRLFKNIDEFTEPNELLGHYIVRKNF